MKMRTLFLVLIVLLISFYYGIVTAQRIADASNSTRLENAKKQFEAGNYEQANKILSALVKNDPNNAEAHFYLGRTYIRLDDLGKAVKSLEKATTLRDTSAQYHFIYGNALFMLASRGSKLKIFGRIKKGRKEFERVILLDPDHIPARYSLMQYYLHAPGIMGGDKKKARQLVKEINEIDSNNMLSLAANVQLLITDDKFEAANDALKKSVLLCETTRDSLQVGYQYNMLGYAYLEHEKYEQAITSFKTFIKLAPQQANAHDSLGEAYFKYGELDSSIVEYKKALAINPDFNNAKKMLKKVTKAKEKLKK